MKSAIASLLVVAGSVSVASAVNFPEVEPNNSKGTANTFLMSSGDTITGTAGTSTADPDYFRLQSSLGTASIYRHTLTSSTTLVSLTIRGVNAGFVAGDVDFTNAGTGRQAVKWYTMGSASDNYVRAARSTGTAAYTLTMATTEIIPSNAGSVNAGTVTIDANLAGDSELFLYDSSFNLIGANDNRAFGDVRAQLSQTLANGVYYIAVGSGNSATAKAYNSTVGDPFFDAGGTQNTAVQLDAGSTAAPAFANPFATLARPENLSRSASDFGIRINGGDLITTGASTDAQELAFYRIEVIPSPASMLLVGLGGVVAGRRRRN